ncbi:helix-turn-helix transcriptional regulator [Sediminibacterium ginsengisoli]|uniref:AraC-type DNA-binding protein n=1 Tax=Sediminibacterium ginsengisoli TaxID=413434 RepID=A0A1T4PNB4_9BACT|nr:AraC family transcriptional regulator [Sediminibacterium ginsengisoli]SJZ93022.1 AraC-type DNA-binding protein [Sediminibacterium ginsengisoli]
MLSEDIYQRVVAAKLYMDGHLHEPICLADVARQAFFSRFHFHRLFTRIYRRTPHEYLTMIRMEAARTMLEREPGTPITEVAAGIGFESHPSFSNLFRKRYGHTPAGYRQIALRKKEDAVLRPKKFIPHCFIESLSIDQG